MKHFVLGSEGKTCIWPIPNNCTWTGERYKLEKNLTISVQDSFLEEAKLFVQKVNQDSVYKCEIIRGGKVAVDVRILQINEENLGKEGYLLEVTDKGIVIKANNGKGAVNGCMTLLQLISNSPDSSIPGVTIEDKPREELRCISLELSFPLDKHWFQKLIDFCVKYKINGLHFRNTADMDELGWLIQLMKLNHIESIGHDTYLTDSASFLTLEKDIDLERTIVNNIYRMLKYSCISWWDDMKSGISYSDDAAFCEWMERILAQLYPIERDRMTGIVYPSIQTRKFMTINIRSFYNAPLYRLCWNPDDYDFIFMTDAKYVPNTVPFSILQGVADYKLDNGFILTGNGWNEGITGIEINNKLDSLCFLHSEIIDHSHLREQNGEMISETKIGSYVIHYIDGVTEEVEIVYGRNIYYWNQQPWNPSKVYEGKPAYIGVTSFDVPYVMYSYEWVNNRPNVIIDKIDIIPLEKYKEGGIAVFAVTGILHDEGEEI